MGRSVLPISRLHFISNGNGWAVYPLFLFNQFFSILILSQPFSIERLLGPKNLLSKNWLGWLKKSTIYPFPDPLAAILQTVSESPLKLLGWYYAKQAHVTCAEICVSSNFEKVKKNSQFFLLSHISFILPSSAPATLAKLCWNASISQLNWTTHPG